MEIEGFRVEKLISKAIAEGIVFRHIRCISDTCMELTLTAEDSGSGYKISGMNNESTRKYTTFGCCYPTKKYGDFIGYYNMKYDKVNGAFYIDCNEKKTF